MKEQIMHDILSNETFAMTEIDHSDIAAARDVRKILASSTFILEE